MSVSGIGGYSNSIANIFSAAPRSASASSATSAGNEPATASSGSAGVQSTDFTSMTRKELFDWMNSKIKSGEMSFDESTTFVSMTLSFSDNVNGTTGLDNTEHVNFVDAVQKGIRFAQQRNDSEMVERLQKTLRIMDRYQGEISGVDIRA